MLGACIPIRETIDREKVCDSPLSWNRFWGTVNLITTSLFRKTLTYKSYSVSLDYTPSPNHSHKNV